MLQGGFVHINYMYVYFNPRLTDDSICLLVSDEVVEDTQRYLFIIFAIIIKTKYYNFLKNQILFIEQL